jgi:transcription termination/antitermination protein NusA
LTGWDIDILTPPEFQAGVQRLDLTLKSIEGVTQEYVDKIIALGLIDVRDIDEVGTGPLMEEVGMAEELATTVMERCADEAKIVATEQEAKKAAEAAQKAADAKAMAQAGTRGVDGVAFANPLLQQAPLSEESVAAEALGTDSQMPGALQATEGVAPEIGTHAESAIGSGSDLSPEESAIHGVDPTHNDDGNKKGFEENGQVAELAEGRESPPASKS